MTDPAAQITDLSTDAWIALWYCMIACRRPHADSVKTDTGDLSDRRPAQDDDGPTSSRGSEANDQCAMATVEGVITPIVLRTVGNYVQNPPRTERPPPVKVLELVKSLAGSNTKNNTDRDYSARIAVALLLLGHGYTDEAHALVSPLTWIQETKFGFGPPVATRGQVMAAASYAHSLVHRREGPHPSEFEMTGFQNAHYWTGATLRGPAVETLPLLKLQEAVMGISKSFANNAAVQTWCNAHFKQYAAGEEWDPRWLHDLCREALSDPSEPELQAFAEQAALAELQILLRHVLHTLLGYSITSNADAGAGV